MATDRLLEAAGGSQVIASTSPTLHWHGLAVEPLRVFNVVNGPAHICFLIIIVLSRTVLSCAVMNGLSLRFAGDLALGKVSN